MKIDLHVHTKYSLDSISQPEKIMKYALKRGLNGVAVTDHNTTKGWNDMLKTGEKFGMKIVLGEEVKINWNKKYFEIMGLFLNESIKSRDFFEVVDEIKSQDGIVCAPHPFDMYKGMRNLIEDLVKNLDAIEVFNSRLFSISHNRKAFSFAKKHDLGMTAGSDAHTNFEVGNAYVIANANSIEELKRDVLKGKIEVIGNLANPSVRIWCWLNQGVGVFRNI